MIRLEDWTFCIDSGDGYTAPELLPRFVTGLCFGHPRHADGERVSTSHVVHVDLDKRQVRTASGSVYILGVPAPAYVEEMARRGVTLPRLPSEVQRRRLAYLVHLHEGMNTPIKVPSLSSAYTPPTSPKNGLRERQSKPSPVAMKTFQVSKEQYDALRSQMQAAGGFPASVMDQLRVEVAGAAQVTDEAIARAEAGAGPTWMESALQAVREVAADLTYFTTDDVWAKLTANIGAEKALTTEKRAMGAVMRKAADEGICTATSTTTKTQRIVAHQRPVTVWYSLIR